MSFGPTSFDQLTQGLPAIIYVVDVKTLGPIFVGGATDELAGYTPEEIIALGPNVFPTIVHPDDLGDAMRRLEELSRPGLTETVTSEIRVQGKGRSDWMWMSNRTSVLARDAQGHPTQIIGVLVNVTSQKLQEQALSNERLRVIHASKLASLGAMAGGVAHEINNPLAALVRQLAPPLARWQSPQPPGRHHVVAASGPMLGYGGFYLPDAPITAAEGDTLSFKIQFANGPRMPLEGTGTIVWQRADEAVEVGVAFTSLTAPGLTAFLDWVQAEQPTSFIPFKKK